MAQLSTLGHMAQIAYTNLSKSVSIMVNMKIIILSLVLVLFASACSHGPERAASSGVLPIALDSSKPHFEFTASDLVVPARMATNGIGSGHDTIVINFHLSTEKAAEFARFTQEHTNQMTQLIIDSRVVAQPFVHRPVSDGVVQLVFSSFAQAQAVETLLSEKR